jgi:hypothetical protein
MRNKVNIYQRKQMDARSHETMKFSMPGYPLKSPIAKTLMLAALALPGPIPGIMAGLQKDDVIVACNDKPVRTVADLHKHRDMVAGKKSAITITRKQKQLTLNVGDDAYVVTEAVGSAGFKTVALAPASATVPAKATAGGAPTNDDQLETLTDGKIAIGYGPTFANGVVNGIYKLDLTAVHGIARVNTFSRGRARARQNFVLYGSTAAADRRWWIGDSAS